MKLKLIPLESLPVQMAPKRRGRRASSLIAMVLTFAVWTLCLACVDLEKKSLSTNAVQVYSNVDFLLSDAATPPGLLAGWRPVRLPDNWRDQHPDQSEHAWYRFPIEPGEMMNGSSALLLRRVNMTAEAWIDGKRIGGPSPENSIPNDFNRPLLFTLPESIDLSQPTWGYIRLSRHAHHYGQLGEIELGPRDLLRSRYETETLYRIELARFASGLVLLSALFAAVLWLATQRDPINGTFAWAAACCAVVSLNYWVADLPMDRWAWERTVHSALSGFAVGVALWSRRMVRIPLGPVDRTLRIYLLCVIVLILILPIPVFYPTVNLINALSALTPLYAAIIVLRNQHALSFAERVFYLSGAVFGIIFCLNDFAIQLGWLPVEQPYLFPYVMPVVLTMFAGSLIARFSASLDRADRLNADLQFRVEEKAAELTANYSRLDELERERILLLERERLTREMHDGLGGQLVSTLALVESAPSPSKPIATALRTALADLRSVIDSLDPRIADYGMLFGLLRGRIQPLFESEEIRIRWRVGDLPEVSHLAPEQNLHLLRILQEAFSNALRHAEATEIEFSTDWQGDLLILRVRDDGRGIGESNSSGRGLPHMQTRARALGAEIEFKSSHDGTCVEIRLPLE